MSIINNSLGFGRLAAVAWTPLEGSGLAFEQAELVRQDAASAQGLAKALLAAVNAALNRDWSSFTLADLSGFGLLVRLPNGDESPQEWATFVKRTVGVDLSPGQSDGLNGWRRLAGGLQQYSAGQVSRLSPVRGAEGGGGLTHANGQWYANGQALSLVDLFTAARVNRLANYDDSIDGYVAEIKENQRLLVAAREWGSVLRAKKPTTSTAKVQLEQVTVNDFKTRWGIDPLTITTKAAVGSDMTRDSWDAWLTELKSFIDKTDTKNQTLQGQIDQKSNRRNEVMEAILSFARKESKIGRNFASNLA